MAKEEVAEPALVLSDEERKIVKKTLQLLRQRKPHYYVVLRTFLEHGRYRGFYAELAAKLGITANGVKKRLAYATEWFSTQCRNRIKG